MGGGNCFKWRFYTFSGAKHLLTETWRSSPSQARDSTSKIGVWARYAKIVAFACRMLGTGLFGPAPVPTLSKKTRVQLNYGEKRRICEVHSLNPQWTQDKISQYVSKEFGKSIRKIRSNSFVYILNFLALLKMTAFK